MESEFLCQDLEAKLFNWFAGRLDASIIKRSSEVTDNHKRDFQIDDFQVGEVVVWKINGEKCVVVKHIHSLNAIKVVFDSERHSLCWCRELSKLETT
jgi:hypothetical protein